MQYCRNSVGHQAIRLSCARCECAGIGLFDEFALISASFFVLHAQYDPITALIDESLVSFYYYSRSILLAFVVLVVCVAILTNQCPHLWHSSSKSDDTDTHYSCRCVSQGL